MFRVGFTLLRRLLFALSLLILVVCGVEVGVRVYEAASGSSVCSPNDTICGDPAKLTIPSWSVYQELKPLATALVESRDSKADVEIHTNSLGLRAVEPAVPKPPNVYRILVMGDETIFAPETAETDHFCTVLQNLLQPQSRAKIEVINAGIPGHCPLTEYLVLKQRLLNLQPDLVLLHFDWSDVSEDRQIRRSCRCDAAGLPQSCAHAKLVATKKVSPVEVWRKQFRLLDWGLTAAGVEWKQKIANQKAASRESDVNPYAWLRDERPQQNVMFRQAVHPIADLAALCRSSSCQFVVFTSPKPWQVSAKCSRGEGVRLAAGVAREAYFSNREPFRVLARFAFNAKIPFVDTTAVLTQGPDVESNFLRHAPRWSPAGHRKVAESVVTALTEKLPGPWNGLYNLHEERPVTSRQEPPIQWTGGQQPSSKAINKFPE